jgi:Tol biopolymer transport system component/DNA-binding winged helix-turn-helix (wHTH) protein
METRGPSDRHVRFRTFEFDLKTLELHNRGRKVAIRGHAAKILASLLENPGEVVTRTELRKRLWPDDTFVDWEHILNNSINKLREAFGDDAAAPRFIETLPGLGYRFIASVDLSAPTTSAPPLAKDAAPEPTVPETVPVVLNRDVRSVSTPAMQDPTPSNLRKGWTLLHAARIAAIMLLLAGLVFVGWHFSKGRVAHSKESTVSRMPANFRVVPVTKLPVGSAGGPAISPDGEKVAYFWDGADPGAVDDLYVQMIDGEKPLRLTNIKRADQSDHSGISWSPDGQKISYARCDIHGGAVVAVPVLGGAERKLADLSCKEYIGGRPIWTADGESLIIDDACAPNSPVGIVLLSLQTGERRCLDSPPASDLGDSDPKLSPDGRTIAFLRFTSIYASDIYTVAAGGGDLRRLTSENMRVPNLMWTSDGQHIVFTSWRAGLPRVWRVPAAGGVIEPEPLYPRPGSMSRDGRRVVYEESGSSPVAGWRADLSSAGGRVLSQNKIVTSNGNNGPPQPSPDGKQIVFGSTRSGNGEIWKSNADGSDPQQLTFFKQWFCRAPRWSPDGKRIAFDVQHEANRQIYLMDSDGRNQRILTSGNFNNQLPSWSSDGNTVYFASNRSGGWQVWKRELANGRETQLTRNGGYRALESYDGKTLYYSRFEGSGLWKLQLSGGEEQQITTAPISGAPGCFAVTEAGIYLGGDGIMYYDFQTRKLKPVFTPKETLGAGAGPGLGASRDGRKVFMALYPEGRGSISMLESLR